MSLSVTFNGTSYTIPQNGERNWGTNVTTFLQALGQNALAKGGGAFTLTADVNFGNAFGLIAAYFKSASSNIAGAGVLRLANADGIGFRNIANSADLILKPDADGILQYNGVDLVTLSATQTLTNKTLTSPTINTSPSVAPTVLFFGASASLSTTGTAYLYPGFSPNAVAVTESWIIMPAAGKLSNLYVREATGSTTSGVTYTVRQNVGNTGITCTAAAGAGIITANDTTHTVTVAAGDIISISAIGVAGITGASGTISASILFTQA